MTRASLTAHIVHHVYTYARMALLISSLSFGASCAAEEISPPGIDSTALSLKGSIIVDNRVLASVRGHVITVYDVMKKLDMIFYRQFPEYRSSPEARLQFYRSNWRLVLKDSIDRQLVTAYAEDKQFLVSNGDVREELEEMFGPNVMMNLYDAGLSLYDVQEMLKADILMRRILSFFVRAPVMASITPERVRKVYEERKLKRLQNKGQDSDQVQEEWTWQALTIAPKSLGKEIEPTPSITQEDAEKIYSALNDDGMSFDELKEKSEYELSLSQPFSSDRSSLSPQVAQAILNVPQGQFSHPIMSQLRNAQRTTVWKLYKLVERKVIQEPQKNFAELEPIIREEIAAPLIAEKTQEFFNGLKKQYGVHFMVSEKELESFEPFHLAARSHS